MVSTSPRPHLNGAARFDTLANDLVADPLSSSFIELRRGAPAITQHDELLSAGWRGLLLGVGVPDPAAAADTGAGPQLTARQVDGFTELADAVRGLASTDATPDLVDLGNGCARPELLAVLLELRPTIVRVELADAGPWGPLLQVRLQQAGYLVLTVGHQLVALASDHSAAATRFADRLVALLRADPSAADFPLRDDRALDRAALRWAERSFRQWRAVMNERDALLAELSRMHEALDQAPRAGRRDDHSLLRAGLQLAPPSVRRAGGRLKRAGLRLHQQVRPTAGHPGEETVPSTDAEVTVPLALDAALRLRLEQLATHLGGEAGRDPLGAVHGLLRDEGARSHSWWLVHAVVTGSAPTEADVRSLQEHQLEGGAGGVLGWVVAEHGRAAPGWQRTATVEIVTGRVLVDVTHTVQTRLQTGVQRVVRNVVPTWLAMGAEAVVYDQTARAWRRPDAEEAATITGWSADVTRAAWGPSDTVLVLDSCTVLVPELKPREPLTVLRAASTASSNSFRWIVYDLIPLLAAEYVPDDVVAGSADYLATIKRADRLVAISASSAAEFSGLVAGLASQGIPGPSVTHELLPLVPPPPPDPEGDLEAQAVRTAPDLPLVLCVSSISPHKNQEVLLAAAARLARQGAAFELVFVAPNAWHAEGFRARLAALEASGVAVALVSDISDAGLWSLYRAAHCVVMISRVEGYGLPLAEALTVGTPVLSSDFGSMAEIVAPGGGLMTDPTDVDGVARDLARVLDDAGVHAALSAAAAGRQMSSWEAYARRTWHLLLEQEEER